MEKLNCQQTIDMLDSVADSLIAAKEQLGRLDAEIGDGDHGIGMALGMQEAKKSLSQKNFEYINDIFFTFGMAMMTSMGGASGVIFSLLFMGGANKVAKSDTLNKDFLVSLFDNALCSIKERGKAEVGDKTMVDALEPAVGAMKNENSADLVSVLKAGQEAAWQGAEATKNMVAKFGRSKSLGERALGYVDAGSISVALIFRAMADFVSSL